MKTLNYYTDPGHGWLEVPRKLLEELDIDDSISPCSYEKGKMVYLEHDVDAGIFVRAHYQKYGTGYFKFNHISSNDESIIRSYDYYGE